ncbi:MAG: CPBP family glutamic-type intramembrane protease, partial [Planctomycetota bacterium]
MSTPDPQDSAAAGPSAPVHRLDTARFCRLCKKELLETLRDRRTIVTLILMPLLVYPLLSMALNRFLASTDVETETKYRIGVASVAEANAVALFMTSSQSRPPDAIVDSIGGGIAEFEVFITTEFVEDETDQANPAEKVSGIPPTEALEQGRIDIAAEVSDLDSRDGPRIKLFSRVGDAASESARRILVERMQWFQLNRSDAILSGANIRPPPLNIELAEIGEQEKGSLLASILPLVLVLMTITGAVYPAIDLTAGERERNTMEALVASPVPPFWILCAKYVAVIAVAILTAIANLVAMFTTLWVAGLLSQISGQEAFPWLELGLIFGLLILFAAFFSAVLLSLTSFARSFKEAQAYLIPVMLLSLGPAMISLLPGVTLTPPLAIVPLVNIVLLAREMLAGSWDGFSAVLAAISTLVYAAAALAVASKMFGNEAVSKTGNESIGTLLKRPEETRAVPSPQAAAMVLALLVPVYFLVSNLLLKYLGNVRTILADGGTEITAAAAVELQKQSMIWSAVSLIAVFGGVPLLAVWFTRSRPRPSYRWFRPSIAATIAAALAGLGTWALGHEAYVISSQVAGMFGVELISEARVERYREVIDAWTQISPLLILLTLAVTPAIIEELCFRGFLFSALLKVLPPRTVMVLTAFLFGGFHVVTGNMLLLERFLPTTLMGLLLGWVAYRTGSVIPGMVTHAVHNGLL